MQFSPLSFVLGVAAAALVPLLSRVARPLAVETTAAGIAVVEGAQRFFAEQAEMFEDIWAEAKARHEQLDGDAVAAAAAAAGVDTPDEELADPGRARRRGNGGGRRRAS
jgi:Protein of unknown function (DUF5132)